MRKIEQLNNALINIRSERFQLAKREKALRSHRKFIGETLRGLSKAGDGWVASDSNYWVEGEGYVATLLRFGVAMRGLEGFKDQALKDVLEKFVDWDIVESRDYADYLNRDFIFAKRVDDGTWARVTVGAYVKSESETCRKVLKEVKTVVRNEEVFELVCD